MVTAAVECDGDLLDLEAIRTALAQRDLLRFTQRMFPAYVPAPHHVLIARFLHMVRDGLVRRLVFCMPPRHGKSELCSVHFPAWYLGNRPDNRVIACSYAAALADRFSRRSRNLLTSPNWPFGIAPAGDLAQVRSWDISDHSGGYIAAGVGGAITGVGADLLLIDDPVKNAKDALSETVRQSTWEWYTSTAYTRLEPNGAVVVIGTRWHEDDLIGRLISQAEQGEEGWTVVRLPALSESERVEAEIIAPPEVAGLLAVSEGAQLPSVDACFRIQGR